MIIKLPVQLNPISRRKDRSVKLSFETRELQPSEIIMLMSMEQEEGWLLFSSNDDIKDSEIPEVNAELETKTQSQRMKAVLYKLYLQDTKNQKYVGTFENYYKIKTEMVIEKYKSLIEEND